MTAPLLAQVLGVDGRGALAAATAPFALAAAGLTLGFPEAMTYFVARKIGRGRDLLAIGLVNAAIIGISGSVGIFLLSRMLSGADPQVEALITIVGFAVAPSIMAGTIRGYVRGLQLWGFIATEQVVGSAFRLVAILLLFGTGNLTPLTAGVLTAGSSFVGVIVYLAIPRHLRGRPIPAPADVDKPSSRHKSHLFTRIIRFGMGIWIGTVAGVLLSKLDQVLLLPLSSAAALGLFAVAVSIADVVRVFNSAVRDVVFSIQSAKRDDEALGQASRVSTIFTAMAAGAVFFLAWALVPALFGVEFAPSVGLVGVLLLGTIVGNVGSVLAAGLSARGKPLLRSVAMLLGVCINVAVLVILVPPLGAMGAAIAAATANAATGGIVLVFAYRVFGLSPALFLRFRRADVSYTFNAIKSVLKRRGNL